MISLMQEWKWNCIFSLLLFEVIIKAGYNIICNKLRKIKIDGFYLKITITIIFIINILMILYDLYINITHIYQLRTITLFVIRVVKELLIIFHIIGLKKFLLNRYCYSYKIITYTRSWKLLILNYLQYRSQYSI